MRSRDALAAIQVRNCARHAERSVVGARGEPERRRRALQQGQRGRLRGESPARAPWPELRVAVDPERRIALELPRPCAGHSITRHRRLTAPHRWATHAVRDRRRELADRDRRHLHVKIDAVEQGPGYSPPIAAHLRFAAPAGALGVRQVSARTPLRCPFAMSPCEDRNRLPRAIHGSSAPSAIRSDADEWTWA